jgi:hypothetical protein
MNKHLPTIFATTLALTSTLCAQKTLTVDAAGGADFESLPTAVASAGIGDLIIVRKGNYTPPTVTRGMSIICKRGVTFLAHRTFAVIGLRAGERFSMVRTKLSGPLLIQDCAGNVHLQGVDAIGDAEVLESAGLTVKKSQFVTTNNCDFKGATYFLTGVSACEISNSTFLSSGCKFEGGNWGSDGLIATDSRLRLTNPTLTATGLDRPLLVHACDVTIGGDARTSITTEVFAALVNGGSLLVSPTTGLDAGDFSTSPSAKLTFATRPAVVARTAIRGKSIAAEVIAPSGSLATLYISLAASPIDIPSIGELFLDVASLSRIDSNIMGSTAWTTAIDLPKSVPAGQAMTLQASVVDARGSDVSLPVVVVTR